MKKVILILDNIRSVHNVGSIFRTSDATGVSKIYLCGTTPAPLDRFGRERKDIEKTSLGAEKTIPWEYFKETKKAVEQAKSEGFTAISLELDPESTPYNSNIKSSNIALILGPEVTGISKEILKMSDKIIEIPMRGEKESLNVSVAAGVALYELLK